MGELSGAGRLIVVGFDPGETTGYARLSLSKRLLTTQGTQIALREATRNRRLRMDQLGEGLTEPDHAAKMMMLIRLGWVEEVVDPEVDSFVVVVEDFILYRSEKSRSLLAPVRLTALLEGHLQGTGIPLVKQSANDAKNTVTDARLRRWELYDPEGLNRYAVRVGGHSRDAMRHVVLFARKFSSHREVRDAVGTGLRKG